MRVIDTALDGVLVLAPQVFEDARGYFFESYSQQAFESIAGKAPVFVQDNHARSRKGVLRGMHYQVASAQDKLVRATVGEIFDAVVDVRKHSRSFGKWYGLRLSAENKHQVWVPRGFAHGYYVISEYAEVQYKTTDFYDPAGERSLLWSDPAVAIDWPLDGEPILSEKDRHAVLLEEAETATA